MTLNDTNRFLYASIREVIWSLAIAVILVVLVVYLFLQDIRATLIPTLAIFVSVIGTFGFMAIAGFSINLLTLFALVLAIGTVVDNAIIVVEAVQARFESGYKSSYMATNDAMGGHYLGHRGVDHHIHGGIYPYIHDRRNIRHVLYSIRGVVLYTPPLGLRRFGRALPCRVVRPYAEHQDGVCSGRGYGDGVGEHEHTGGDFA